jgi:hypothetical protein
MSFKVKSIEVFERQSKRLAKKYPSLKSELFALVEMLKTHPDSGTSLGNNCYKIRLSIASKEKGKSGGGRVITNVVVRENSVYLLSIYDKSEKENLTDKELQELLSYIP